MNAWPQAFGVQDRMSWTVWVPEVLREFRFLTSSPATCPWGFFALVVLLTFCCGCLAGGCAAAAIFSNQCRRLGLGILRVCVCKVLGLCIHLWICRAGWRSISIVIEC